MRVVSSWLNRAPGAIFLLGLALVSPEALACATCLGAPEAPMTRGLNMGILSLLVVVLVVLGGAAAFFVHLAKRAAAAGAGRPGASGRSEQHNKYNTVGTP